VCGPDVWRMAIGVARRIAELYEVKMNALPERAEDPRQVVDCSDSQLRELLAVKHRGAAEIAAGRNRAEMQVSGPQRSADRLREQADQPVAAGREDLARQALARRLGDPRPGGRSARPAGHAVTELAGIMAKHTVSALPVLDADGRWPV